MRENLKKELAARRDRVFTAGRRHASAHETVHAYTREIDSLMVGVYASIVEQHKAFARVALVAVGGYGRGEMCPYSDIDILILCPQSVPKAGIEAFTRAIWDMGTAVGCVVRTLSECAAILGDDPATDNAFLDVEYVAGSRELFGRLCSEILRPFYRRQRKPFLRGIRQELHDRVYSSENTLFRIEPDIKNGICALRDGQRILWGERVSELVIGGQQHPSFTILGKQESDPFLEAYFFLLGLRVELHMTAGRRLDLLEIGLQGKIAAALGLGLSAQPAALETPEARLISDNHRAALLMEKYFRAVSDIRHAVHVFLERAPHVLSMWDTIRHKVSFFTVAPGLALVDGYLFPKRVGVPTGVPSVLWMLDAFENAITCQADLSIQLRNMIHRTVANLPVDDFRNERVYDRFLAFLSRHNHVGRMIQLMHETTFLEGIIPEFGQLRCRVEYDSYHEYTTDEHTILALCGLDQLPHDTDKLIRTTYLNLPRPPLLRLALLLHDVGKVLPGSHSRSGAIIAETVASRLGFTQEETGRISFLVYNHLSLSELSLRRESEEQLLCEFAGLVGDQENLDMLFLLTVLDIRHVGPKTWTGWKAAQLKELFLKVSEKMRPKDNADLPPAHRSERVPAGFDPEIYLRNTLPEERREHLRLLNETPVDITVIYCEEFVDFGRLTVLTRIRKSLLSDFVGCLFAEGLRVLKAGIHSTDDGRGLYVFDVQCDSSTTLPFAVRVKGLRKRWRAVEGGEKMVDDWVEARKKRYPAKTTRPPLRTFNVTLNNDISPRYSVLEVDGPDMAGLLHRITLGLSHLNITIVSARISTLIDQARDVFYLTDEKGAKITGLDVGRQVEASISSLFDM